MPGPAGVSEAPVQVTVSLRRLARVTIFGRSPLGVCLRIAAWLWRQLPPSATASRPVRAYGALLHALARLQPRRQSFGTFFLRNRPELDLMTRLVAENAGRSPVRIAVVACSIGAEVYSILWAIRSTRPDLKVTVHAIDLSPAAVEFAKTGVYTLAESSFHSPSIFERLRDGERERMFETEAAALRIRPWLRDGIVWCRGDAGDRTLVELLGPHDIVVANRFLCHMDPPDGERCLRSVANLVKAGGYLFVSGVDLDVRTTVARDLGWQPVPDLMEAIHDGDPSLRRQWPCGYTGLEPFDRTRADWRLRYASVFRVGSAGEAAGVGAPDRVASAMRTP